MRHRLLLLLLLSIILLSGCTNTPASTPVTTPAASESEVTTSTAVTIDGSDTDKPDQSTPITVLQEEPIPEETPHKFQGITVSAIGDILFHDNCLEYVRDGDKYDFDPPFSEVMPYLQSSDLSIGNLETTISGASAVYGTQTSYLGYPKFNTPDGLLDTLKKSGLDVLINANNHCMDRGTAGLMRTLDQLDERGLLHTGAYRTREDSEKILMIDIKGIKLTILAYSYSTNGLPVEEPCVVNLIRMDKMLNDIEKAKELKPDIIIAYLHLGIEYDRQPNWEQKDIAERLIKAGADIILQAHTHMVQPMEFKTVIDDEGKEKQGLIMYSLGNFITGMTGPYKNYSVIFNIDIKKDMETGKVYICEPNPIPAWLQFYNKDGRDTFRVIPMEAAISKYENKQDNYITEQEYEDMKARLPEILNHIKNGPAY